MWVKLGLDSKMRTILSTRSGVGWNALLGRAMRQQDAAWRILRARPLCRDRWPWSL
jgi:hypothetical protein